MRTREKEEFMWSELTKPSGKSKEIICSGGEIALIDEEDYPVVVRHSWVYTSGQKKAYAVTTLNATEGSKKTIMMHNLILGFSRHLDHINGNTLDNRKGNLRPATYQQNGWNTRKRAICRHGATKSQYKGVSPYKSQSFGDGWQVIIKLTKKYEKPARHVRLGPFRTETEAAIAYNEEIVKHRGEFAWLNEIPSILG